MKSIDNTKYTCKICGSECTIHSFRNHLRHYHNGYNTERYVKEFEEFRPKVLHQKNRKLKSGVICKICNKKQQSHKQLLHHIHNHNISWEDYFIKYFFDGQWPLCKCGCGSKVKLLRHGKNEKGEQMYARTTLPGHQPWRKPGYRFNSPEQKEKMRKSAIERMEKEGKLFNNGPSSYEQDLKLELNNLGINNIILNEREILSGKEIDIFLPEYNIGIEMNGSYFHSDLHKPKNYHLSKTIECESKNIRLIHIWEPDWVRRKEIVLSNISNILNKTTYKIPARKCKIKVINNNHCNSFLQNNHLQGAVTSKVRLGLYYNNELVSVMSFSHLRRATGNYSKENHYELIRFCNKINTTVVGGASKLFKFFIKNYNPQYILSYANRDWSTGKIYTTLGMEKSGNTPPGYFYVKSKYKFSRFQFTKHKLISKGKDPNKTEYEIMMEDGYYRVWDCGNLKFEWGIVGN